MPLKKSYVFLASDFFKDSFKATEKWNPATCRVEATPDSCRGSAMRPRSTAASSGSRSNTPP